MREAGLLGTAHSIVAVDGSHFKASAAKASLINAAQLARQQTQTEQRITDYLAQLDEADQQEQARPDAAQIKAAVAKLRTRKQVPHPRCRSYFPSACRCSSFNCAARAQPCIT